LDWTYDLWESVNTGEANAIWQIADKLTRCNNLAVGGNDMPFPVADWAVSLFFLFALVLVARFKKQISAVDKDCLRNIVGGLAVLALVSVAHVYNKLGVFENVPFVSDPTFYQLLSWIGVITGMAFLVFGVSSWLPIARHSREFSKTRIRRLDFIKKVEQLVSVESRLDIVLSTTLEYMIDSFGFSRGAVYKYSPLWKRLTLASHVNMQARHVRELTKASFDETSWRGFANGSHPEFSAIVGFSGMLGQPAIGLPIVLKHQPVGFFLVWSTVDSTCDNDDYLNLKTATDIIARKIETDFVRLKSEYLSSRGEIRADMSGLIDGDRSLKENLSAMMDMLQRQVPFDFFSISIADSMSGSIRRLSRGRNLSLLEEPRLRVPANESLMRQVRTTGEPLIIGNLQDETPHVIENILISAGMNSCLMVPVTAQSRVIGVVTLADRRANRYRVRQCDLLQHLAPVFADLIRIEEDRIAAVGVESRLTSLTDFLRRISEVTTLEQAYRETVTVLREDLATCLIRVSEIEDKGAFLKSRALTTQRPIEGLIPADGRMILSLMPHHRAVIDTGRRLLINQENARKRMSEAEASQSLTTNLKSALLVPVKVNDEVVALLSLVEMRSWDRYRFSHSDALFAEAVAQILAGAIMRFSRPEEEESVVFPGGRMPASILEDEVVRTRLRSSLTGILGSVELLQSAEQRDEAAVARYLSIIDSSAHKIQECLTEG
jgi:GAF domain-containing protein